MTAEHDRLDASEARRADWKKWGPYLAERAWGTVREDYSATGEAWEHFPHDHARSRAYRWNEDGLAGFCDHDQTVCLGLGLWNERDPILKERLFGVTGTQGNHGEDVKEYYYLDSTPTHSYAKMLYKYPQVAYPYADLVHENERRGKDDSEYELVDAIGDALRAGRYFDVFVEYAKAGEEDILCRITAHNRGPDAAPLHLLPHVWFRNTWSWTHEAPRPQMDATGDREVRLQQEDLGERWWYADTPTAPRSICSLPTTRRTASATLGSQTRVHTSRTASTITWCTATRGLSIPTRQARRPPRTSSVRFPPARPARWRCASPPSASSAPSCTATVSSTTGGPKRMRSTTRCSATICPRTRRASSGRPSRASCGRSSFTITTWTSGWRAIRPSPTRRRAAGATADGSTSTTKTWSRCQTPGSIPGTRPGIWPST